MGQYHLQKGQKPILCSANTKIIVSFGLPMGMIRLKNENRYIVPFPEINSNFYGEAQQS